MNLELGLKSTILEALIEKITNVQNKSTNNSAIEAFTKIITDEPESARTAIQLITTKIQSPYEWEALQALYLLESCMSTSSLIQAEIGKFRFLNELIKLVSPKYLGNSTPSVIKNQITSLLKGWSDRYPKETKIKEAFDMLIKQGVVMEDYKYYNITSTSAVSSTARPSLYDEDDEKSKLLQKLLRSNKPNDLKAANHLIKTMVKEKEEKEDLRLISNNAKLLSEMLSNASCNTSTEELELMRELKETCVNMKPTVAFLISSSNKTAKDAVELFELNDLLNDTLRLYHETMTSIRKASISNSERKTASIQSTPPALLDFSSPIEDVPLLKMSNSSSTSDSDLLSAEVEKTEANTLEEIFSSTYSSAKTLKKVEPHFNTGESSSPPLASSTLFQDLDILGKSLLESNSLVDECSNKVSTMNLNNSTCPHEKSHPTSKSVYQTDLLPSDDEELINGNCSQAAPICDTWTDNYTSQKFLKVTNSAMQPQNCCLEPMSDIYVPLVEIETDGSDKIAAFEDATGVNVCIQLAKNKPRYDVAVFLVLSCSHKNVPISNFLFQPVVPKDCRLKLQSPSKCDLPPFNPHIPVDTIVQIMLIASFKKEHIPLKFVISYIEKDEMKTEMGEVTTLRLV